MRTWEDTNIEKQKYISVAMILNFYQRHWLKFIQTKMFNKSKIWVVTKVLPDMNPSPWRLTTTSPVSLLSSRSETSLLPTPGSSRSTLMCSTLQPPRSETERRERAITRTCLTTRKTLPANLSGHVPAQTSRTCWAQQSTGETSGGASKFQEARQRKKILVQQHVWMESISRSLYLDAQALISKHL